MTTELSENILPESLANLSFQEIFELKNKIGEKNYNALLSKNEVQKPERTFHRENKNRPREMSSKLRPSLPNPIQQRKKEVPGPVRKPIDPRFSHSCGEFDPQKFDANYKFLKKLKRKERKQLTKELTDVNNDENERQRIKFLLQRMDNQNKQKMKQKQKDEVKRRERDYQISELQEGRKPRYHRKSEKKLFDLISQFEHLKEKGGLVKHIKRRRKKLTQKDRKNLEFL